jgi:hypothetical protein
VRQLRRLKAARRLGIFETREQDPLAAPESHVRQGGWRHVPSSAGQPLERCCSVGRSVQRWRVSGSMGPGGGDSMTGGMEARLLERQPWPALSGRQSISQSASRRPDLVSEEQSQSQSQCTLSLSHSLSFWYSCLVPSSRQRPMCRLRHTASSADRTADVGEHSLPRRRRGPAARLTAHGGRQQAAETVDRQSNDSKERRQRVRGASPGRGRRGRRGRWTARPGGWTDALHVAVRTALARRA